jgi:hypothetical protein
MRKLSIFLVLGALALAIPARPARAQVDVNVSIGGFHDELAPYGQWVGCEYGQCWVPARVASNWQPYTNGQWVYTEYGWTWVSDDPWGGNPYHYGTWTSIPHYGWSWVPGTVWAPAWVTWSYSNNYVGWAPLPPTVVFGASGYGGSAIIVSSSNYVFVPTNRFVGVNVSSVRVSTQQNATIFRQTTPVTRFAVSGGYVHNTALPMETIQRASGARIETRNIRDAKATPHSMSAGQSQRVSVVAPAREVNAAVASRPQTTQSSPVQGGQKQHKSDVNQTTGRAASESQQGSPHAKTNPAHQEQKAAMPREAPPVQTHDQTPSSSSHAQHAQNAHKAPAHVEAPPPPSGQQHEVAPAQGRSESVAQPAHQQAPAHAHQPPPPNQAKKPVEKDKKAEKGKKDEKGEGPSSPKEPIRR